MKIVKKAKNAIYLHLYKNYEPKTVIQLLKNQGYGAQEQSMRVLTNMFKYVDGDEWTNMYWRITPEESRLVIDNRRRELVMYINEFEVDDFIEKLERLTEEKTLGNLELLDGFYIAKKKYVLMGFNQQHKPYINYNTAPLTVA